MGLSLGKSTLFAESYNLGSLLIRVVPATPSLFDPVVQLIP